jgi:hypothetical protein
MYAYYKAQFVLGGSHFKIFTSSCFPMALQPKLSFVLLCIEVSSSHTAGLLWTSDQPVVGACMYTGQHNI